MAIYQEGGHFQFHRDSLHADNHQATLLLEVRSAHEGGKFVIDHYGGAAKKIEVNVDKETHDTSFEMNFDETGSLCTPLKWIAFYTDALHKVERVTSGTRVVIQYDVYIHTDTGMPAVCSDNNEGIEEEDNDWDSDENSDEPYLQNISNVFSDYRFPCISNVAMQMVLKELEKRISTCGTKNVAIPLFHCYSAASIKHELLKGPDRLLFDAIVKEKKYVLGLSPVVITAETYDENYNNDCYRVKFTDPMTVCYYWSARASDVRSKKIENDHVLNSRGCMYVVSQREDAWNIEYSEYIEWVGNYAQPARFKYFLGVMVVGLK